MSILRTSSTFRLSLSLALLITCGNVGNGQQPEREQLRASGVIKAMQPGVLHIVTDDGVDWLVKVEAKGDSLSYFAEADTKWLKAGMLVQFSSRFDTKGAPQEPIRSLKVVNPRPDLRLGVTVDAGLAAGADGLFERETDTPKKKIISADVVGRVVGLKDGTLNVITLNAKLAVELAEKAVISVEFTSLQMAKIGDNVEVSGWYPKGYKGRAIANRVTVRAQEPLKGWVKPPPKTKASSKANSKASAKSKAPADPLNGPADPLNGPVE